MTYLNVRITNANVGGATHFSSSLLSHFLYMLLKISHDLPPFCFIFLGVFVFFFLIFFFFFFCRVEHRCPFDEIIWSQFIYIHQYARVLSILHKYPWDFVTFFFFEFYEESCMIWWYRIVLDYILSGIFCFSNSLKR